MSLSMSEDTMKLSKTTARAESYAAAHTAVDCSVRLIRHAEQSDLEGIERLLTENKLPTAGVRESLDHFVIAEDRSAVIGAIGLEVFGDSARETAPEGIRGSVEFRGACPASATLMVRIATPKEGEIEQSQGSTR